MNRKRYGSEIRDWGPEPLIVNISNMAKLNTNFRTALWTGEHFQITLMSIRVGKEIGLESHPDLDQFLRVESGYGLVEMGDSRDNLNIKKKIGPNYAVVIPAGTWHNLTNIGSRSLKLYSIYAPPAHPFGTVHETKEIADESEGYNH